MISFIQNLGSRFRGRWFSKETSASTHLHHYTIVKNGSRTRVHLREDGDGQGTLILNANKIVHFNPTATMMAKMTLKELPESQVIKEITKIFRVPKDMVRDDYKNFQNDFQILIQPENCPVCNMDNLEITTPFSARPTAPYRMDLAITYRCNDDCAHCYNARPRDYPEISTSDWKVVIDNLWDLGIPHIVFTGGEPTLRDDLPELIAHAEANGQITGINTNARRLSDPIFIQALVESGLDHIQVTVESHNPTIHDQMVGKRGAWKQTIQGLRNLLNSDLYVMTNTTMLQANSSDLGKTLDFLAELGVPTIGLNALIYAGQGLTVNTGLQDRELPPLLDLAQQKTSEHGQRLIWYTPTQYCQFDPQQLDLGVKGCTAALYNMCVEPDGGVIACQSYYQQLGNILFDPWDSIWNHEISKRLRDRLYVPAECNGCLLLDECGGGCPLALEAQEGDIISIERVAIL